MVDRVEQKGGSASTGVIAAIAAAALVFMLVMMNMVVNPFDESLVLQGAVEVAAGFVPHRDFFWFYGPLELWVLAGLFAVFGKAVIVARLFDVIVRAGLVLLCALTARRLGSRASVVVGVMAIETLLFQAAGSYLYPVFPAALLAMTGTMILVGDGGRASGRRLAGAGVLTGLTALVRYDIGAFLLMAHLATLALFGWEEREPVPALARRIAVYGAGVAIVFVPVAIWGWAVGAVPGFAHDILTFPRHNYARMRGLPWPVPGPTIASLVPLGAYIPFLIAALAPIWLVRAARHRAPTGGPVAVRRLAAALLLLTITFALKGVVRVSLLHSVLALVPALPVLAWLAERGAAGVLRVAALAVAAFAAPTILLNVAASSVPAEVSGWHALLARRDPIEGGCRLSALGPALIEADSRRAACYIAAHTRPGEPIFIGLGRYDVVYACNPGLYFFTDRMPPTHWFHLEPGLTTEAPIQRAIIGDLERRRVRLVVVDRTFDGVREPNRSAVSSGVHLLDRFIAAHFTEVARFGEVTILTRTLPPSPGRQGDRDFGSFARKPL